MASRFAAVTNKEISHKIKQVAPKIYEEGDEVRSSVWKFQQVKLCLFYLNLSMKPVKKFFVLLRYFI